MAWTELLLLRMSGVSFSVFQFSLAREMALPISLGSIWFLAFLFSAFPISNFDLVDFSFPAYNGVAATRLYAAFLGP